MKTNFTKLICLMAGTGLLSCSPELKETKRPNILFIMSDDHAYQAVSAYSDELIQTPNIDRLAKEGAIFTRATVTNSICAPSRAVLLTGKHSFINGKVDNVQPFNWDQPNFPKLMQANGYQTAMIGKIHLDGIPQGFDFSMVLPGQGRYFNPDFLIEGERIQLEGHVSDIITEITLDWLENKRDPDKPFCLLYHHKAPHREWEPAERHYREFTQRTFREPANLFDDYEGRGTAAKTAEMNILKHKNWAGDSKLYPETIEELGIEPTVLGPRNVSWDIAAFERTIGRYNEEQKAAWDEVYGPVNEEFKREYPKMNQEDLMRWRFQRYMQDYLGTIAGIDEGVGQVLDYLDEAGLTKNTIVILLTDHGYHLFDKATFGKNTNFENGTRVPLIIRQPNNENSGKKTKAIVELLDIYPTLCEMAGLSIPSHLQGKSFVESLVNPSTSVGKEAAFSQFARGGYKGCSVRTDRYRYTEWRRKTEILYELYDYELDPSESKNRIDDPMYKDVIAELSKLLHQIF